MSAWRRRCRNALVPADMDIVDVCWMNRERETERLRRDRHQCGGAHVVQSERLGRRSAQLRFVDVESMLDGRRTLTFSAPLSSIWPTDRQTERLGRLDQCLQRRESYTAAAPMTFCHPPRHRATAAIHAASLRAWGHLHNGYQTKPFASSLGGWNVSYLCRMTLFIGCA